MKQQAQGAPKLDVHSPAPSLSCAIWEEPLAFLKVPLSSVKGECWCRRRIKASCGLLPRTGDKDGKKKPLSTCFTRNNVGFFRSC